jgi:hypothetical protein
MLCCVPIQLLKNDRFTIYNAMVQYLDTALTLILRLFLGNLLTSIFMVLYCQS